MPELLFSAEQLNNLRAVFGVLDEDGAGEITARELLVVLRKIDATATIQAAEAMIQEVDLDQTLTIDFEEFKSMMAAKLRQASGRVGDMMRLLDIDQDGVLTRREIRDALERVDMLVSEDDVDEMMRACDRGDKGNVTTADLEAMFTAAGVDARQLRVPAVRGGDGGSFSTSASRSRRQSDSQAPPVR